MSSYFSEHDCNPLPAGEAPNDYIQFARFLLLGGYWQDMEENFAHMMGFGDKPPPPASKEFMESLVSIEINSETQMEKCPICFKEGSEGEITNKLPCDHQFHKDCIKVWLEKTNSCPVCRYELPTDDKDYEEYCRQKKRKQEREAEIETLHFSMYS